jgi:hypothetical protein
MFDANGRRWLRGTAVLNESKLGAREPTPFTTVVASCKSGITVKVRELFLLLSVCVLYLLLDIFPHSHHRVSVFAVASFPSTLS